MDLIESFTENLKKLIGPEVPRLLLAVSGGLDSVAMAHLCWRAGIAFGVAHANFQLRGQASDADEDFVGKLALDFGAPFWVKRFDTEQYAFYNGLSTQMAARKLRYQWFGEIAQEHGFAAVATAHHLTDSVETALFNFVRGTALKGLRGMEPLSSHIPSSGVPVPLLRPLLFATRDEIVQYIVSQGLEWREDASNLSDDYARNYIRHHIVPRLEELNPNFVQTAARNMRRLRAADQNLTYFLEKLIKREKDFIALDKPALQTLPSPRQAVRQLLKPYGFDAEQTRQIAENLGHVGLHLVSATGHRAWVERERVVVLPPERLQPDAHLPENISVTAPLQIAADDLMLRLPDGSQMFFLADAPPHSFPADPNSALLDASKLQYPLHLRHWRPGDLFQPLGLEGKSQKLQDFFTNQKVPRLEKDKVWLLLNGDGAVLWVVGWRLDERFKIQPTTTKTLKITWIK
jgi:tRNA(Ile)-lysidine synthase